MRTLRELGRSYLTVTKDLTRVMNRLKALYRSWAIPCAGQKLYSPRHRSAWLEKLSEAGVRRRAERLYQQFDILVRIRQDARRELLTESQKHPANQLDTVKDECLPYQPAAPFLSITDEPGGLIFLDTIYWTPAAIKWHSRDSTCKVASVRPSYS